MNSRRRNMKRKKQIRNTICIIFCIVLLLLTVGIIRMLTLAIGNLNRMPESIDEFIGNISPKDNTESPSETESEKKEDNILTVCIDAGHGGKDNGTDSDGRFEKDDSLRLALAIQTYLESQNIKVVMTRSDDTFLNPPKRCDIANQANVDYFVSVHRNKGDGTGVETWIYSNATKETEALADNIQQGLSDVGIQRDRGVKKGTQKSASEDYYVNSNTKMPSCLIELGFINVAKDNQLFDNNLESYAKAIGDAILKTAQDYHDTHIKIDDSKESVPSTEDTETNAMNTGHTLKNTPIDITGLDTTILNWGQGSNVDDQNRPTGSLMYQQQFGKYNAYFIGEGDKTIYLTFDEGYEVGYSSSILDTLKEKNVKAVFFITQPYARDEPELVQRMIDEGHMIGNHSVTHPSAGIPSLTVEKQQDEIEDNHNYVKEHFGGYEMHLFRYPAGKFSEQSLAIINNCNYKSVFWSFAYMDYDINNQPDETESLQKMIDKLHSGAIYLLHAESSTNTNVLGSFIDQARALGYEFALYD